MKQIKIIALTCLLLSPARPLSETTDFFGSVIGGVATGALVEYFVLNELLCSHPFSPTTHKALSVLAGIGAGTLTCCLLHLLLYSYTPSAKFRSAQLLHFSASVLYNNAAHNPLLEKYFSTESELHDYVTAHFGTSWPLIQARKIFMDLKETLSNARLQAEQSCNTLQKLAIEEPAWAQRCTEFTTRCIDLLNKIAILEVFRDDRTVAITNNEQYIIQTKLYENHQEAEKQRQHSEEEARRQREHQRELEFAKLSHKSNTQH